MQPILAELWSLCPSIEDVNLVHEWTHCGKRRRPFALPSTRLRDDRGCPFRDRSLSQRFICMPIILHAWTEIVSYTQDHLENASEREPRAYPPRNHVGLSRRCYCLPNDKQQLSDEDDCPDGKCPPSSM